MWKIILLKKILLFVFNHSTTVSAIQRKGLCSTLQCQFFWPSVRVINHFAVRRAALCGQHILFLTAQRCFGDGWQGSVSGTCLLTEVIGGNISEPVAKSEWPNHGVENAEPVLRGVSKDGASLLSPPTTHTPVGSAKRWQSLCSRG